MPHVELSLTDTPSTPHPRVPAHDGTFLERWAAVVVDAPEPCLVLDAEAVILAASASCVELIGLSRDGDARGRKLRDAVLPLVDFTADPAELDESEAHMIPPLLAISSGRMARGLIRVACPESGYVGTLDAITTPLRDGTEVVGSLTFFASI